MVLGACETKSELCRTTPSGVSSLTSAPDPRAGAFLLALTDFQMPRSPAPSRQPDADQTAPPDEALKLQPLPDGTLQIVARVVKEDAAEPAT